MGIVTFDQDITIYYKNQRTDEWNHIVAHNASWYGGQKVTVTEAGLNAADAYTVRIREIPDGYMKPEAFNQADDKTGKWTIQSGDVVVKGAIAVDVSVSIVEIIRTYEAFTVTGHYDNRRGPKAMQHIRVEGT